MKRQNWMNKILSAGALVGALFLAIGCSNEPASGPMSPVKSTVSDKTSLTKGSATTTSLTPLRRKTRSTNGYGGTSSKVISSNGGGSLSYRGHTMEVSKYSFSEQQKEFYITDVNSDLIQANYGPDGWFLLPVKITISYADADLTNADLKKLTIAWYSETLGMWIDVGGMVDRVNKTISVYVWHFTQYTISMR